MLELTQGGRQRRFDILAVRPRAEVHQQLAHIAVALANAGVDLFEDGAHRSRIAGAQGVAHQLHLDLDEGERLRDRVVEFARKIDTLLSNRRLLLQRIQAQVLHRTRQVAGQRIQQGAQCRRRIDLGVEEEIDFAGQAVVQTYRNVDHRLETSLRAGQARLLSLNIDREDLPARLGAHVAAVAAAFLDALFRVDQPLRHALRGKHHVALVIEIGPAHGHAVGACNARHAAREPLREILQHRRVGDQAGHFIQAFQPLAFLFEFGRLLGDLVLQVAVHRLQVVGHAVEPPRQRAELVAAVVLNAGVKITLLDRLDGALELADRFQHEDVAGVDEDGRADDRQGEHGHLKQVEQGRPARHMRLDPDDQRINPAHERCGIRTQLGQRPVSALEPARTVVGPTAGDSFVLCAHAVVPRHEKRPLRVAFLQHGHTLIELADLLLQHLVGKPEANRKGNPVGLHAHAPGLIDRRRAAVELPRHPQRCGGREEYEQEKRRAKQRELGAQAPFSVGNHRSRFVGFV